MTEKGNAYQQVCNHDRINRERVKTGKVQTRLYCVELPILQRYCATGGNSPDIANVQHEIQHQISRACTRALDRD